MPVIGEQRGIAPGVVGVLLALRAGSSMATRIGIGRIVARFGREPLIISSALAAAVSLGAIAFVHDVVPLAVLCVITGIGLGFGQPLSMTLIVQLVPDYARGTALARPPGREPRGAGGRPGRSRRRRRKRWSPIGLLGAERAARLLGARRTSGSAGTRAPAYELRPSG